RVRPTAADVTAALTTPSSSSPGLRSTERASSQRMSVGRESERRTLERVLDEVRSGQSRMVLVAAEAGMGKTTLVEDFLAGASDLQPPPRIARGRCSERLAGTGAYLPIIEALQSLAGRHEAAVLRAIQDIAPSWYSQVASASKAEPG